MSWYRNALLAEFKQAAEDYTSGIRGQGEEVVYLPYAWADVAKFADSLKRDQEIEAALTQIRDELAQTLAVRHFGIAATALTASPLPTDPEDGAVTQGAR